MRWDDIMDEQSREYGQGGPTEATRTKGSCDPAPPGIRVLYSGSERPATGARTADAQGPYDASDDDKRDNLAHQIRTLYAHVTAANHRLLTLIAEFDRLDGWEGEGHRTCAHWVAFHLGLDPGAAREKVRVARALETLPRISDAMARGELSYSKVRALTRVATADSEQELLEYARATTTGGLERLVRGWKRTSRSGEEELERQRHRSRAFSIVPDWDGSYVVRGRLDPEVGALLMRAVEAAGDALYRKERQELAELERALGLGEPKELRATPKQRRADAIGLVAERALGARFGEGPEVGTSVPCECRDVSGFEEGHRETGGSCGDCHDSDGSAATGPTDRACGDPEQAAPIPLSGTRAERHLTVLYVDEQTLDGQAEPGRSELEDGTRVSAETSRRLACDASVVRMTRGTGDSGTQGSSGSRSAENGRDRAARAVAPDRILDVGRKTRTVPPAIRRALEARDRGCRFPGCGLRFTDAHHVRHWADGGATRLDNLVLLCRRHHRAVHEDGFTVRLGPTGQPTFTSPRGLPLPDVPEPAYPGERPVEALIRQNRLRGIEPDGWANTPRFKREVDIPWRIEAAAREALETV